MATDALVPGVYGTRLVGCGHGRSVTAKTYLLILFRIRVGIYVWIMTSNTRELIAALLEAGAPLKPVRLESRSRVAL